MIVVLKSQFSDLPDTPGGAARRSAAVAASQRGVLAELAAVHARGIKSIAVTKDHVDVINESDQSGHTVDVVAPGDLNWALCSPKRLFSACVDFHGHASSVELEGGTSEAAPLTAGVAALVIQAYKQGHHGHRPTPAIAKQIIVSTARDIDAPAEQQGAGLVDALSVGLRDAIANLTLIAPNGDLAEYNFPQGFSNLENAQVANPAKGTWTALISLSAGSFAKAVPAEFLAQTATWRSFGKLSTRSVCAPSPCRSIPRSLPRPGICGCAARTRRRPSIPAWLRRVRRSRSRSASIRRVRPARSSPGRFMSPPSRSTQAIWPTTSCSITSRTSSQLGAT